MGAIQRVLRYIPSKLPTYFYTKEVILSVKIATITIAGIFMLSLLALIYVQLRNFCSAQTTSERYSRRKNPVQNKNLRSSDSSTDSLNRELLNKDEEEPDKYIPKKKRGWWGNCWDMCWSNKIESQEDIYNDHIKS